MTLRFTFNGKRMGKNFQKEAVRNYADVADRSRRTMNIARNEILTKGAADIRAGGKFGSRWIKSLQSVISPASGRTINMTLETFHTIKYAIVHETGKVIHGKPLLWIPLPWTGIKIRARDWGKRHGGLFQVKRKGKNPLLLSIRSGEPKYVGVRKIRLKRRFHLRAIIRKVAASIPSIYRSTRSGR